MADIAPVDMVVDMTDTVSLAPEHLVADVHSGTGQDDVVITEDSGAADPLPANAQMQDDGSVILTLRYPVTLKFGKAGSNAPPREERYETLHMHRLNGAAMRAVSSASTGSLIPVGIAKSCRMPQFKFDPLYDRMDAVDTTAAAEVFSFFLYGSATLTTGSPPSP